MADDKSKSRQSQIPLPDFEDSADLRRYLNSVRAAAVAGAFIIHLGAEETQAACEMIEDPDHPGATGWWSKIRSRRKAKRVRKHLDHAEECFIAGAAATVRCWGEFKRQYNPDLPPVKGRRRPFKIVDF